MPERVSGWRCEEDKARWSEIILGRIWSTHNTVTRDTFSLSQQTSKKEDGAHLRNPSTLCGAVQGADLHCKATNTKTRPFTEDQIMKFNRILMWNKNRILYLWEGFLSHLLQLSVHFIHFLSFAFGFLFFFRWNTKQINGSTESTTSWTSPKATKKQPPSHSVKLVHIDSDSLRPGWPPSWVCLLAPTSTWSRHLPAGRSSRRQLGRCLPPWCRWLKGETWSKREILKICVTSKWKNLSAVWAKGFSVSLIESVGLHSLLELPTPLYSLFPLVTKFLWQQQHNPLQQLCYRR